MILSPAHLIIIAFLLAGPVLFWLIPRAVVKAIETTRAPRRVVNYRGRPVPLGLGWAWFAWGLLAAVPLTGVWRLVDPDLGVLVSGVALLGWLDDRHGSADVRGFRGHLAELRRGRVTTGLLKLAGIAGLALAVGYRLPVLRGDTAAGVFQRAGVWLVSAAVIALAANFVNLLDTRPGRALKAYSLLALPAQAAIAAGAILARHAPPWSLLFAFPSLFAVLGPVLACWRDDLGERAMLGDMGANAAGALAGWLMARALPLPGLTAAAIALLALNLASERVSFSAVIERNAFLRWADGLGRLGHVGAEAQDGKEETEPQRPVG